MAANRPQQSLLQEWRAAASNLDRFSLMTLDQTKMYQQTVAQLAAAEVVLDRLAYPINSGDSAGSEPMPFKPLLDDAFVSQLGAMQVMGMRLFEPRDAFVALRIDPMRDLMAVLHFVFVNPFALTNTGTLATAAGTFVSGNSGKKPSGAGHFVSTVMFEQSVTLSGHETVLSLERVAFAGYFFGVRERILFDQTDAPLSLDPSKLAAALSAVSSK